MDCDLCVYISDLYVWLGCCVHTLPIASGAALQNSGMTENDRLGVHIYHESLTLVVCIPCMSA